MKNDAENQLVAQNRTTSPDEFSEHALKTMDEAVRNLDAGIVSAPVDLSDFQR